MKTYQKNQNNLNQSIRSVASRRIQESDNSLKNISVAQLARTKNPRPARKIGGRRYKDPFRKTHIKVKILTKSQIESAIRRSLESTVWKKMIEMNPRHNKGDFRQRGQETNNVLHTDNFQRIAPHDRDYYQAMMRHLSTVLASGYEDHFVEVQSAITFSNQDRTQGTIYVSANAHEGDLINNWEGIRAKAESLIGEGSRRLRRHSRKAINEIDRVRENFNIQIVSDGVQNQHAETRIDDRIRDPHAIYGGLRRPCGACRINFQLKGRAHVLYNHTGQLWTTNAASKSIVRFALPVISERVVPQRLTKMISKDNVSAIANAAVNQWIKENENEFVLPDETYLQGNESVRDARGHDTDSEGEDE